MNRTTEIKQKPESWRESQTAKKEPTRQDSDKERPDWDRKPETFTEKKLAAIAESGSEVEFLLGMLLRAIGESRRIRFNGQLTISKADNGYVCSELPDLVIEELPREKTPTMSTRKEIRLRKLLERSLQNGNRNDGGANTKPNRRSQSRDRYSRRR